ncbi:hypothetical protein EDB81DRAFT_673156 [Dactylonectria macrodidyma]|uniref:Uncharacterized protein n=1 Tax=Dactylonectria macrodidyma TaxID=307937 RepID=A0A9P9I5W9_9HYPO|nr:hypothetical protein EDB81DRAFT_673156 [Dactylonectria macrodidyma]
MDPDHDSGYASASRVATWTVLSDSNFRDDVEPPASQNPYDVIHPSDEIQSLSSDNDDIGSQASDETTNEGMTGKALIRVFLAEEPQFRALCEKALAKMGRQRFVENLRRLLKSFHKNLSEEAETEAEKAVVKLLHSRRGRLQISNQLAAYMQQEKEGVWGLDRVSLQIVSGDKRRTEQDLRKDFMLMFLPSDLRHVLLSIPRKYVWVSLEQDLSFSNRVKAWVEDNTQLRWNWWPLKPRKRLLQHGESRVFWQCSCGAQQWEEISAEQHEFVAKILAYSDDKYKSTHWCGMKGEGVPLTAWFRSVFRQMRPAPATTPPSAAAQKYTPAGNAASISSSRHLSSPQGSVTSGTGAVAPSRPGQQRGSTTGQQVRISTPNTVIQTESWILFSVQGAWRTLVPSQIPVNSKTTDHSIFQELKRYYQLHRGRLRLWFSI